MKLDLTDAQYDAMMLLVDLGTFAMQCPMKLALILPPQALDLLQKSPEELERDERAQAAHPAPTFDPTADDEDSFDLPDMPGFHGMALKPDLRPVLAPKDIQRYLRLFRTTTMALAGITSEADVQDLDETQFNDKVNLAMSALTAHLRKQVVFTAGNAVLDPTLVNTLSTLLADQFERGAAIASLLKEVKKPS